MRRRHLGEVDVDLLVVIDLARPRLQAALDLRREEGRRVVYSVNRAEAIVAVMAGLDVAWDEAVDGRRTIARRAVGRHRRRLERLAPKLPTEPRIRVSAAIVFLAEVES